MSKKLKELSIYGGTSLGWLEDAEEVEKEITMATIKSYTDLRYQVYSLKRNGDLDKPITMPILARERANKYFSDCAQCALVSIDENGTIVEVLEKNTTPLTIINKRTEIRKRKRR